MNKNLKQVIVIILTLIVAYIVFKLLKAVIYAVIVAVVLYIGYNIVDKALFGKDKEKIE